MIAVTLRPVPVVAFATQTHRLTVGLGDKNADR